MSTIELGLIYVLVTLGVYISFRVLNFADLTVDGSFTLGAFMSALFMDSPALALCMAFIAGGLAGSTTGLLYNRLKIMDLLASILVLIALYSINLRIMNIPNVIVDSSFNPELKSILFLVVPIAGAFVYFFNSFYGLKMRASGQNKTCASAHGINTKWMTTLGLILSNGLIALSGGLMAFYQGFADINIGTGTLITGLASVILGEQLLKAHRFSFIAIFCILGSILYRAAVGFALSFDFFFRPSDLNLLTSIMMILLILISKGRQNYASLTKSFR